VPVVKGAQDFIFAQGGTKLPFRSRGIINSENPIPPYFRVIIQNR